MKNYKQIQQIIYFVSCAAQFHNDFITHFKSGENDAVKLLHMLIVQKHIRNTKKHNQQRKKENRKAETINKKNNRNWRTKREERERRETGS